MAKVGIIGDTHSPVMLEGYAEWCMDVFDQWGVLHNGTSAYAGAIEIIETLANHTKTLAVLSNSGKRSAPNIARIAAMGFKKNYFQTVLTSGEVLWQDMKSGRIPHKCFYPIERTKGDAAQWAHGSGAPGSRIWPVGGAFGSGRLFHLGQAGELRNGT